MLKRKVNDKRMLEELLERKQPRALKVRYKEKENGVAETPKFS